jgi:hypothetical protein
MIEREKFEARLARERAPDVPLLVIGLLLGRPCGCNHDG